MSNFKRKWWVLAGVGLLLLFISFACCGPLIPDLTSMQEAISTPVVVSPSPTAKPRVPEVRDNWFLDNTESNSDWLLMQTATPTLTTTPVSTPNPDTEMTGLWVRVGWNEKTGANCHLYLDAERWNAFVLKITTGTVLQVLETARAPVYWQDSNVVLQVNYQGQSCYIRRQLVNDLPLDIN